MSGITEILANIQQISYTKLWMILGFVSDKDINGILQLLPKDAHYVFCQAQIPRALSAESLAEMAATYGLQGQVIKDVNQAIDIIEAQAAPTDFIYIGGSTFVVSEIAML
jgi:dihydrofolate synthase/folylpolyglutamate synthase